MGWNALFLHQSVGQDLEEGCKANGYPFDYYGKGDKTDGAASGKGLKGGIFVDVGGIPNGNPYEKMRVFKENATRNKDLLQVMILKFGYADIQDDNFEKVKTEYKALIDALRAQVVTAALCARHAAAGLFYCSLRRQRCQNESRAMDERHLQKHRCHF
jgi:hypothetical protein